MFIFQIGASDVYAVLGRVLDRTRVAGLKLSAVTAQESESGDYTINAVVDTADRDMIERLARQFVGTVGVTSVSVEPDALRRPSRSATAALEAARA